RENLSTSLSVCWASSRVGSRISARMRTRGSASPIRRLSTGSTKAAVLPLPVWAMTRRSLPASAGGMASRCTGVGSVKFSSATALSRRSCRAKSANTGNPLVLRLKVGACALAARSVLALGREQLDLVAIRVFHEGQDAGTVLHRTRLAGDLAAAGTDVLAGLVDVLHFQGDVAVAVAQVVLVDAPVVGQLDDAVLGLVAVTDECQGELPFRVVLAAQQGHAQHFGVEGDGFVQIADAQHGMQQSHGQSPEK